MTIEYLKIPTICEKCVAELLVIINDTGAQFPMAGYCGHETDQPGDVVLATVFFRDGSVQRVTLKGPMPEAEAIETIQRGLDRAKIILQNPPTGLQ